MTTFSQANNHLRAGNPAQAIPLYLQALRTTPDLCRTITPGIILAKKRYRAARQGQKPSIAVCGWELAHNPAGRAYNLAQMYATLQTRKSSARFSQNGAGRSGPRCAM